MEIKHKHNHLIECVNALKERDVSNATKNKLVSLLQFHSPVDALNALKSDLKLQYGPTKYPFVTADRSLCPDIQYVYRYTRALYIPFSQNN